jgi:hypothetical protein
MEMEPQDAARFEEITILNDGMGSLRECILAQDVSHRVKMARLRTVKRDAQARQAELDALIVKYEKRQPHANIWDTIIKKLQEKLAKL